ncbi:MAG: hypothetical protein PHT33_14895, partial [bacterium]|nr:hypothetical protein [bacterium]
VMGARLPERAVGIGAAVIFFGFGLYSMVQGGKNLGPVAWAVGAALLVACLLAFLYLSQKKNNQSPEAEV